MTLSTRALMCVKGACEAAQPLGTGLGIMLAIAAQRESLKFSNRDPIFIPIISGVINSVLPHQNDTVRTLQKTICAKRR